MENLVLFRVLASVVAQYGQTAWKGTTEGVDRLKTNCRKVEIKKALYRNRKSHTELKFLIRFFKKQKKGAVSNSVLFNTTPT
jgi:hypothetical protein